MRLVLAREAYSSRFYGQGLEALEAETKRALAVFGGQPGPFFLKQGP